MANAGPETIPDPVLIVPTALVENTYAREGDREYPDLESDEIMERYLEDRFVPDQPPLNRRVAIEPGAPIPVPAVVPGQGVKEVTRLGWSERWIIPKKVAAAVTLAGLALNFGYEAQPLYTAGRDVWHAAYRFFNPVHGTTRAITVPGRTVIITETATSPDRVNATTVNQRDIVAFRTKVERAIDAGGVVRTVRIDGEASDEWSGDASIGRPDRGNRVLSRERAANAGRALVADMAADGDQSVPIEVSSHEVIISPEVKADLEAEARKYGFANLDAAINAVDNGARVNARLARRIRAEFTSKRGAVLTATVEKPGHVVHKTERIPGHDNPPPGPDWKFPIPLFLIPLKGLRRRTEQRPRGPRIGLVPGPRFPRLRILKEDKDRAWVRLRPEAENQDGTLVDNPWAYTRKFEHYARDDRVKSVMRADFTVGGEDRSLRLMFVDHEPEEQTVQLYSAALKLIAAGAEKTGAGKKVTGIFIHPSENAGLHGEPKRIGPGVDKQLPEDVLGICTPLLKLIEMHMPVTDDPEELARIFATYADNPVGTLGHEQGHEAAIIDEALHIKPVRAAGIPNARIPVENPWKNHMGPVNGQLHRLGERNLPEAPPVRFDVVFTLADNDGEPVRVERRVTADELQRLLHVNEATIVDYRISRYSDDNGEHFPEVHGANIRRRVTGVETAFEEAGVHMPEATRADGTPANFAAGYRPDPRAQAVVTRELGAEPGYPLTFSDREIQNVDVQVVDPREDELWREVMIRSRNHRILRPNEMIAVLADRHELESA